MQNRKPFNLERALAGDPVVDDKGNEYVEFAYLKKVYNPSFHPVIGVTKDGYMHGFDISGKNSFAELYMATKTTTYWANVYKPILGVGVALGALYKSEEKAKENIDINMHYIKTISLDIEDEPKKEKKTLWIGVAKKPRKYENLHITTNAYNSNEEVECLITGFTKEDYEIIPIEVEV